MFHRCASQGQVQSSNLQEEGEGERIIDVQRGRLEGGCPTSGEGLQASKRSGVKVKGKKGIHGPEGPPGFIPLPAFQGLEVPTGGRESKKQISNDVKFLKGHFKVSLSFLKKNLLPGKEMADAGCSSG